MQLVRNYLESRGLHPEPWPDDLRYHPHAYNHTTQKRHHAMICAVRDVVGQVVAVHQTFLTPDGQKISGDGLKARLFMGAVKGGTIRLAPATDRLTLCEGIEDALSVIQCTNWPCWATGSAGNMPDLPETIREVMLCLDADEAGQKAVQRMAQHYSAGGLAVRIAWPPHGAKDWNESLKKQKAASAKAAQHKEYLYV